MGTSTDIDISRNEKSLDSGDELEIYLDKTVLDLTIEEYEKLKDTLFTWLEKVGLNVQVIYDSTGGEASYAIQKGNNVFCEERLEQLLTKTDGMIKTMSLASYKAHRLLLRCENFYEILEGCSEYCGDETIYSAAEMGSLNAVSQAPLCSELVLINTYYGNGGGELCSATEDAVSCFNDIEGEKDTVQEILSELEIGEIDISSECSDIQDDCDKKGRLDTLYESFVKYVNGVNLLNVYACEGFDCLISYNSIYDYARTYEYPEYKAVGTNTLLHRVLVAELHEMGITDEELNRALANSDVTLKEIVEMSEAIITEDKIYKNGGIGMALFRSVLRGEATDYYSTFIMESKGGEIKCWNAISNYLMKTMYVDVDKDGHSVLCGHPEEYKLQMNAALSSRRPVRVMDALRFGAFQYVVDSNHKACVEDRKSAGYDMVYRNYKKDMIVYDMFNHLSCYVEDTIPSYLSGSEDHFRYLYSIDDLSYSEGGGLKLDFEGYKAMTRNGYCWDQVGDTFTFSMTASYYTGPNNISEYGLDSEMSAEVMRAERKQREFADQMLRSAQGLFFNIFTGYFMGNTSIGGKLVDYYYDAANVINKDDFSDSMYKKYIDLGVNKMTDMNYTYASDGTEKMTGADVKAYYQSASNVVYDIYKYLSYNGVEKAHNDKQIYYWVKYTGSGGGCVIETSDGETTKYATLHTGFVAPEYLDAFEDLKEVSSNYDAVNNVLVENADEENVEKHGLYRVGEWDDTFTNAMLGEIEKLSEENEAKKADKAICKKLIIGGYDVEDSGIVGAEDLSRRLDKIQNAYTSLSNNKELYGHIPEIKTDEKNEIAALWGAQSK